MIIKKSQFKKCPKCGNRKLVSDEEYGCDGCGTPIEPYNGEEEYLHFQVFNHGKGTKQLHCCSWGCVFIALKKQKSDYFISLPYVSFDMKNPKMQSKEFWKAVRKLK